MPIGFALNSERSIADIHVSTRWITVDPIVGNFGDDGVSWYRLQSSLRLSGIGGHHKGDAPPRLRWSMVELVPGLHQRPGVLQDTVTTMMMVSIVTIVDEQLGRKQRTVALLETCQLFRKSARVLHPSSNLPLLSNLQLLHNWDRELSVGGDVFCEEQGCQGERLGEGLHRVPLHRTHILGRELLVRE
ncbi:hypothetical protein PG984_005482 [Apiospora sp. TS-2023a]